MILSLSITVSSLCAIVSTVHSLNVALILSCIKRSVLQRRSDLHSLALDKPYGAWLCGRCIICMPRLLCATLVSIVEEKKVKDTHMPKGHVYSF